MPSLSTWVNPNKEDSGAELDLSDTNSFDVTLFPKDPSTMTVYGHEVSVYLPDKSFDTKEQAEKFLSGLGYDKIWE